MPSAILPEVDHFEPVEPTQEGVDFVDLHTIDFSTYEDGVEARRELGQQVKKAMSTQGFFTLINHGISEESITRQVDIGQTIMNRTGEEEREQYRAQIRESGQYFGFKPRGTWNVDGNKKDNIDQFNVYRHISEHRQPQTLEPYREEIQSFIEATHKGVLYKLLRLFAIALELEDEELFVKLHDYDGQDSSWFRYMKYHCDPENDGKTLWLQGHQDFPSVTILFSQPMASLQVRDFYDNSKWKYVAYRPGAIIVNAGEVMQWFTGGYFKAAIHRVVAPPDDQRGHDRCGVFYFALPNKDVVINTLLEESPVLRHAGVSMAHKPEDAPTSEEWCVARVKVTGDGDKFKKAGGGAVVEKVGKVTTTWFR